MEPRLDTIRRFLQEDIRNGIYPGACVTVLDEKGTPHYVEAGTFIYQDETPFSRNSHVDIASISKLLTALAFHRLTQQGEHAAQLLHAPITEYIPNIVSTKPNDPVTVSDLLSMQARWHTGDSLSKITNKILAEHDTEEAQRKALHQVIMNAEVERLHGTEHNYQDSSYIVLAWVLEAYFKRINDPQSYDQIIHKLVLDPLGMSHTTLHPDPDNCVPSGVRNGELIQGVPHDPKALLLPGHAGFFSTAEDLARLAKMLQRRGLHPDMETPFLTQPTFSALTAPQSKDTIRGWWGMGIRRNMADGAAPEHWYGRHADRNTLSVTGFTGQHLVVYGDRGAVIYLTNYHVPREISPQTGDRPFAAIQGPRQRILEAASAPL